MRKRKIIVAFDDMILGNLQSEGNEKGISVQELIRSIVGEHVFERSKNLAEPIVESKPIELTPTVPGQKWRLS